jgi:hypothetical protein
VLTNGSYTSTTTLRHIVIKKGVIGYGCSTSVYCVKYKRQPLSSCERVASRVVRESRESSIVSIIVPRYEKNSVDSGEPRSIV